MKSKNIVLLLTLILIINLVGCGIMNDQTDVENSFNSDESIGNEENREEKKSEESDMIFPGYSKCL